MAANEAAQTTATLQDQLNKTKSQLRTLQSERRQALGEDESLRADIEKLHGEQATLTERLEELRVQVRAIKEDKRQLELVIADRESSWDQSRTKLEEEEVRSLILGRRIVALGGRRSPTKRECVGLLTAQVLGLGWRSGHTVSGISIRLLAA